MIMTLISITNREGIHVVRCTVERLMRCMGLQGAVRGKKIRTAVPDSIDPHSLDLVKREFSAERPNQLWVADFTYVTRPAGAYSRQPKIYFSLVPVGVHR